MKTFLKLLMLIGILMCDVDMMSASIPDVHVSDRKIMNEGKYVKVAYSDVFTTNIYGQNVEMRIVYSIPFKKSPALIFEILTQESAIYKNIAEYVNSLTPKLKNFVYTGKRICDIRVKEKNFWMMASQYAVAGSSLGLVRLTFDDISDSREDCVAITFPLYVMDSNRYNYNGKNHWKDMLADLCNGDCKDIEYIYYDPATKKAVSVTLPITTDMVLVIQRVVNAYNK